MKTLILPDIHLKHEDAQRIIDNETFDKIIFGGDFFDDYNDTPALNAEMAKWVKSVIHKYNCEVLLSNHDIAYRYPSNNSLRCSGFETEKSIAINSIMTSYDWAKFKPFVEEQGFVFSHAGISLRLYEYIAKHRATTATKKQDLMVKLFQEETPLAMQLCDDNACHPFFVASYYRGGMSLVPGLNWCDYAELIPIKNVNQIFFHTPRPAPVCKIMYSEGQIYNCYADSLMEQNKEDIISFNYDLDCHLKFYATIEDKKLQIFLSLDKKLIYSKQH